MVLGNRRRTRRFQQIDHCVVGDDHPQLPAVSHFAVHLFEYRPPRFVHLPTIGGSTAFENACVDGLENFAQSLEPTGERALGNVEPFKR